MTVLMHLMMMGLVLVGASSEEDDDDDEVAMGTMFLETFGYMRKHDPNHLVTREELRPYVAKMQSFYNLPVTSELDAETVAAIKRPRCGVSDLSVTESELNGEPGTLYSNNAKYSLFVYAKRKKRYVLSGASWGRTTITFTFDNYTPDLPMNQVRREVLRGLKVWSDVTPLKFQELRYGMGEPDIHIQFAAQEHNDEYPFDGQGGTLAHAFYPGPGLGGDAHFDEDEQFTAGTPEGTNLFFVAAHELGHSLGLGHSDVSGSLMAPYYQGFQPNFRLHEDDMMAIQEIYGPNPNPPVPTQGYYPGQGPNPTSYPGAGGGWGGGGGGGGGGAGANYCSMSFGAIANLRGELYTFSGALMWRFRNNQLVQGYPVRTSAFFRGAPSNIDAIFEKPGGTTVMIKGSRYWEYSGVNLKPGFPRSLGRMGLSNGISAAFSWPQDRMIYIFGGEDYWGMYNYRQRVDTNEYPRNVLEDIPGLPLGIDAAFSSKTASYFVRGAQYWRYDHSSGSLGQGFPRNFHNDWLGCGKPQLLVDSAASKSGGEGASHAQVLNFQPMTIALLVLAAMLSQLFILNFQRI